MTAKSLFVLVIEIIIFILVSIATKKIENYQLYNALLEYTKIPNRKWISIKESIAYYITKFVVNAPRFSFAPDNLDYWEHDSEKKYSQTKCEKRVNGIIGFCLVLRFMFGNVIYDVIIVITILYLKGIVSISKAKKLLSEIFNGSFINLIGNNTLNLLDWIQNNINTLLLLIVVLLSLYIGWLKKKKKMYAIEAIWAEEDADRVREVAKLQKELEDSLLKCRYDIYDNMTKIREKLSCTIDNDEISVPKMNDYSETTDKIKDLLLDISKIKGIQIYAQRNRRIYVQLTILELLPFLSDKKYFISLERLSKKYIENNCKNRKDLCKEYAYGVAFLNGIYRFLQFSNRKRKQYNRIVMRITDTDYLKSIIDNVKD